MIENFDPSLFTNVIAEGKQKGIMPAQLIVTRWLEQNRSKPSPVIEKQRKSIAYTKEYREWAAKFTVETKETWSTSRRAKAVIRTYLVYFDGVLIDEVKSLSKFRTLVREKYES